MKRELFLVSVVILLLISSVAHSYSYPVICARESSQMPIKYWINFDSFEAPNCAADLDYYEVGALVRMSLHQWMKESEARFSFKYMGNTNLYFDDWDKADNEILFVCEEAGGGSSVVGKWDWKDGGCCGTGAVILDDDEHGYDPYWAGGIGDNVGIVFVHEVGHVLGLNHSNDPCSVTRSAVGNINLVWGEITAMRNSYAMRAQPLEIISRLWNTRSWTIDPSVSSAQTNQSPGLEYEPATNLCLAYSDASYGAYSPITSITIPPQTSHGTGSYTNNGVALAYAPERDTYLMLHVGHINWARDHQVFYQMSNDCQNWTSWAELPRDSGTQFPTTSSYKPAVAWKSSENAFWVIVTYQYPSCNTEQGSMRMGELRAHRLKWNGVYWTWDHRSIEVGEVDGYVNAVGPVSLICATEYGMDNCLLTWYDAEDLDVKTAETSLYWNGSKWTLRLTNIRNESMKWTFGVGEGVYFPWDYQGYEIHIGMAYNYLYLNYLYDWGKLSVSYYYNYLSYITNWCWSAPGEAYSPQTYKIYKAFSSNVLQD